MILQKLVDKTFKDKKGKVVLWQNPNIALWTWILTTVSLFVIKSGRAHSVLDVVSFGALFAWAWMELTSGINYFRRGLGLIVLIMSVINRA